MKKWTDAKQRPIEFKKGDIIIVKLQLPRFKVFQNAQRAWWKYEDPFSILKKVGKVAYKLQLSANIKIHLVFYASCLKPYNEDKEDPTRGIPH